MKEDLRMGSAFRTWFNQIPGNDPIEQQQTGVMQAILLALMAITVLGIPISLSDPLVTLIDVVVLGLLAVAQHAQRRSAFRLGVRLAVGVMIVAIGLSMQAHSQQSCSGAHQTKFVAFHCAVSLATNPKLRLYGSLFLSFGATSTSDCLITGALDSADVGNGPDQSFEVVRMTCCKLPRCDRAPVMADQRES